jgi:hypothetical protein
MRASVLLFAFREESKKNDLADELIPIGWLVAEFTRRSCSRPFPLLDVVTLDLDKHVFETVHAQFATQSSVYLWKDVRFEVG